MRREIGLFHHMPEWKNLEHALWLALRGKRDRPDAREFVENLPDSLADVGERLRHGRGPVGQFREFTIWDPKKRIISAPCFADRVLHHAMMNVCEPVFERWLIAQTFACRTGRGLRAAIAEARKWSSCRRWYLQLDVRHYFETIPRHRLLDRLERMFGEVELLQFWWEILFSHRPGRDRGMPIGSLTSQHLANFYLGFLDRLIKERLQIRGYARYMDDMVLWHDDKEALLRARDKVQSFAAEELGLELKPPILNRMDGGMDFLGFRFHPGWVGLSRRSRRRFKMRVRGYEKAWAEGRMSERELADRTQAAYAFVLPAKTLRIRRQLLAESIYE